MARTTVEDCIRHCPNHFDLAYGSAQRARLLRRGEEPRVPGERDKPIVVALREIARGATEIEPSDDAPPAA